MATISKRGDRWCVQVRRRGHKSQNATFPTKGMAEATEADADTRYWDNLPDRIHATTLTLPEGVNSLSVDFLASDGAVLRTREAQVTRAGACGLAWVRGQSAIPANPRAPSSAPRDIMVEPVVIPPVPDPAPPAAASAEPSKS